MIVTEFGKDKIKFVEQADFQSEYSSGISHVLFEFTRRDANNLLEAIRFVNNSNWDSISAYTDCEWMDTVSEEGCYPNIEGLEESEEMISGDTMVVSARGDGYLKGFEKYTGEEAFSHSFSWWPLIVHFSDDIAINSELRGKASFDGPWANTKINVVINILTGEVTPSASTDTFNVSVDQASIEYSTDDGESTTAAMVKENDTWRIDENFLGLVQIHFAEVARRYYGYAKDKR